MKPYRAKASSIIAAPAELVYRTLADYHHGHPSILPKQYFLSLEVEQGGFGAGTVINFQTRVLGETQSFRAGSPNRSRAACSSKRTWEKAAA